MRIWSIHPKYLDTKGLVALWRETLLAKHVLEGKTKGYRNHPQLYRFKQSINPEHRINQYLATVYAEAVARKYNFQKEKINWNFETSMMPVTTGQIQFEMKHLLSKLQMRDQNKFEKVALLKEIEPHPMFEITQGDIEKWEII